MKFLDFITNRQKSAKQPAAETSQQQKPETAKEMYSRETANDKTARKPVEQMPDVAKAQARETGTRLDKATQYLNPAAAAPSAPTGGAESPEASRQNMTHQDKAAPDLSPTSAQAGTPGHEQNARSVASETPATDKQEKTPSPAPTAPPQSRGRGGWER